MGDVVPLGILVLVAGVFLLSGLAQAVTGFGSALVAVPLLTLSTDAVTAVVAATLMSLGLTSWAAVREREHLDRPIAVRMVVAGLLGIPLGLVLLLGLGEAGLQVLMAMTVLGALVVVGLGLRPPRRTSTTWSTGVMSGMLLASTGMNGPPLVVGLQAAALRPHGFRSTLQTVFAVQDLLVVAAFALAAQVSGEELVFGAIGILASPLGWLAGDRLFVRVPDAAFRWVLVAALIVSAALLVVPAV